MYQMERVSQKHPRGNGKYPVFLAHIPHNDYGTYSGQYVLLMTRGLWYIQAVWIYFIIQGVQSSTGPIK